MSPLKESPPPLSTSADYLQSHSDEFGTFLHETPSIRIGLYTFLYTWYCMAEVQNRKTKYQGGRGGGCARTYINTFGNPQQGKGAGSTQLGLNALGKLQITRVVG
jgi:hypothetical protein